MKYVDECVTGNDDPIQRIGGYTFRTIVGRAEGDGLVAVRRDTGIEGAGGSQPGHRDVGIRSVVCSTGDQDAIERIDRHTGGRLVGGAEIESLLTVTIEAAIERAGDGEPGNSK